MSEGAPQQIVFISGMSGSGKTTAMAALEDLSFYCVDNLPVQLVPQFLSVCTQASSPIEKIALSLNSREQEFLAQFPQTVQSLRSAGASLEVFFLDCSDELLERRYRETRRVHPHSPEGSVRAGIERERSLLSQAASLADLVIDTTSLNVHQLKDLIIRRVSGEGRETVVSLVSFGFRHGTPASVETLFDVRFLPNPYFEESLRDRTGRDANVARYVLDSERGTDFFERLEEWVRYLLPIHDDEGKAYVTIGIGCTGGKHRSVAIVEALAGRLREMGREVSVVHRDADLPS